MARAVAHRLAAQADDLHAAQHVQMWCTIAAIALQVRAFELCSKAFIKLEALEPDVFEELAIEIFTRCKAKDSRGNKFDCPSCQTSIPDWSVRCLSCGAQFPGCAVSGRVLSAPHAAWSCATCAAAAQRHDLVIRHSCPMCHVQLP